MTKKVNDVINYLGLVFKAKKQKVYVKNWGAEETDVYQAERFK